MGKTIITLFLICAITGNVCAYRIFEDGDTKLVLVQSGESSHISCQADVPLQHCGLTKPNGQIIRYRNLLPGTAACGVDIKASKDEHEGLWTCNFWPQLPHRQHDVHRDGSANKTINVRIVDKLATLHQEVAVNNDEDPATLICVTSEKMVPIDHCYFTSPVGEVLTVDDNMKQDAPHSQAQRYYIPTNKSMNRGDCAITLRNVRPTDEGVWHCNARLEHEFLEHTDSIHIYITNNEVNNLYIVLLMTSLGIVIIVSIVIVLWCILYRKLTTKSHKRYETFFTERADCAIR